MLIQKLKPGSKRFKFKVGNSIINFGSKDGQTFVDHQDKKKKDNYIARHGSLGKNSGRTEDWTNPYTPGFWSRWYLWSEPSIAKAEAMMKKRFGFEFK